MPFSIAWTIIAVAEAFGTYVAQVAGAIIADAKLGGARLDEGFCGGTYTALRIAPLRFASRRSAFSCILLRSFATLLLLSGEFPGMHEPLIRR
jgi:hypothetical protein